MRAVFKQMQVPVYMYYVHLVLCCVEHLGIHTQQDPAFVSVCKSVCTCMYVWIPGHTSCLTKSSEQGRSTAPSRTYTTTQMHTNMMRVSVAGQMCMNVGAYAFVHI